MEDRKILDEFTALDAQGKKYKVFIYQKQPGVVQIQDDVNQIEELEFILTNGQHLEEIRESEFENVVTSAIYKKALKTY